MTGRERKVYAVCRSLWSKGLYPTPTRINERLHGHSSDNINGVESKVRRVFLHDYKIPKLRKSEDRYPLPSLGV